MDSPVRFIGKRRRIQVLRKLMMMAGLSLTLFAFSGCESEGPAEKAGKKIDKAAEKTAEQAREAAEAVKEKAEEVTR